MIHESGLRRNLPDQVQIPTAKIPWGTKAETLEALHSRLEHAHILPQVLVPYSQWQNKPSSVLQEIEDHGWFKLNLIVRSSALNEDGQTQSLAGHFKSVLNVRGKEAFKQAMAEVIASLPNDGQEHQVFVQPQLLDITISGVAFSHDPNTSSPYWVINYDASSGLTDTVTSGQSNQLRTLYHFHDSPYPLKAPFDRVQALMQELFDLLDAQALDIEFAIDQAGVLWLLQVRPLIIDVLEPILHQRLIDHLHSIERKFNQLNRPHPYLKGERTVLGVMPDWNPAEIIGIRPSKLARTLYQELITDATWAYQRHNYGYLNLRSFPLLQSLGGCPYIDVRLSFNSFIPADLPSELAQRLAQYYIDRLIEHPSYHDKVEFEIIFSCYTLDLPQRLEILQDHGFTRDDCLQIEQSLRHLTNRIIHTETGLWKQDIAKISELETRQDLLAQAALDPVSSIYWLLEDCKRYGTLPFAGLARAGFIAVQMLRSLVKIGILSTQEYSLFMANLDTVSSRIGHDLADLSQSAFLRKYGHLRPGTYDLQSPSYAEAPQQYFDWSRPHQRPSQPEPFVLSLSQLKAIESSLNAHQLDIDIMRLFDFIKAAIEGREYSKFVFTRNLSQALTQISQLAQDCGLSQHETVNLDIGSIKTLYTSSEDPVLLLKQSTLLGQKQAELSRHLILPPLITQAQDVWSFELQSGEPNFITLQRIQAPVTFINEAHPNLNGKILFVPSADPGFDWVFSHGIAGLITLYGGANSHMAIRAGELQIPAVIGAGEVLYQQWSQAKLLELDCCNHQVRILQ